MHADADARSSDTPGNAVGINPSMITIGGDLGPGASATARCGSPARTCSATTPDRDGGIALLRGAGVSLIETADVYGPHSSESLIREALHPYPELSQEEPEAISRLAPEETPV